MSRPRDFSLGDSRASQLLVTYIDGWHAIPTPDAFSRHSGTCLIVGDKTHQSQPYALKLGDCLRLGSVGLVVSEIKRANGSEERLNSRTLQYLRDEALSFEDNDKDAALMYTFANVFAMQLQQVIYYDGLDYACKQDTTCSSSNKYDDSANTELDILLCLIPNHHHPLSLHSLKGT